MSTELDLSHPVERMFAQVTETIIEAWDHDAKGEPIPEGADDESVRARIVRAVEYVAARDDWDPAGYADPGLIQQYPVEHFLTQCIQTFRERSGKYAGGVDTWDATFVRAAEIHGCAPSLIADVHVAVKMARREAGDGLDHDDDSLYDSYVDEVNYRILGVALDRIHGDTVPGSIKDVYRKQGANRLWPDDVLDRLRKDLHLSKEHTVEIDTRSVLSPQPRRTSRAQNLIDALRDAQSPPPSDETSPLKERARIAAESLQSEILTTYDHLNGVLASANQIGGVNHWRLPIKKAVEALRPAVKELRVCPTCNQPTDKDVTDA